MFTILLTVMALIVIVFLVTVALRPDFHKWEAGSPWARLDPAARNSFEGKSAGTGAAFTWSGNSKVGEGRMTITESRPSELITMRLEFAKPFKATNTAAFNFKPYGDQTVVAWSMAGQNNFLAKAIGLFMNCDKMVGGQFEKGLANLKSVTERAASS